MQGEIRHRWKPWLVSGIIILLVLCFRVRLLDVPLNGTKANRAVAASSQPPYSEAYNIKFPRTHLMCADILSLFGQTVQDIHLGFILIGLRLSC
jgi:hypothetical protein